MPRQARGEYVNPNEVQVLHLVNRCVRRAFLCGKDPLTGISFEHRREWIRERLEFLASVFGIDCLTYTVMSNHIHVILRSRPDIVRGWSDNEVARRWLRLFPAGREQLHRKPAEERIRPTDSRETTPTKKKLSCPIRPASSLPQEHAYNRCSVGPLRRRYSPLYRPLA